MRASIKKILPVFATVVLAIMPEVMSERISQYSIYSVFILFIIPIVVAVVAFIVYDEYDEKWVRGLAVIGMIVFAIFAWDEYKDIRKKIKQNTTYQTQQKEKTVLKSSKMVCQVKYQDLPKVQIRQHCRIKNCAKDKMTRFQEVPSGTQITIDFNKKTSGRYIDNNNQQQTIIFHSVENYGRDKWISSNVIDRNSCRSLAQ